MVSQVKFKFSKFVLVLHTFILDTRMNESIGEFMKILPWNSFEASKESMQEREISCQPKETTLESPILNIL